MMDRLAVETDGARLDEQRFPGRQGRIVFAYLVAQNGRPVPRDELAQLLWGDELPTTWEKALRVLMTKLRVLLDEAGVDGSSALTSAYGCYQLTLPDGAWIDVEVAADSLARGEAALAGGDLDEARAQAAAAVELARRSFLPGEDGIWVEEKRREQHQFLVQALECLRDASFAAGDFAEAVRHAQEVTELEPFRESGYRRLMEAHAAAGNPAEALRVYERCRRFLGEELGAYPSAETEAVYLGLLRSTPKSALDDAAHLGAEDRPSAEPPPRRRHRWLAVAGAGSVLVVVAAVTIATTRGSSTPAVLPTSLVRIDPETLKPTNVFHTAPKADLIVGSGDYLWITHDILRFENDTGIHPARGRTLTRFDPRTGESEDVPGVAPCGMTPDPSSDDGDVWVLSCYRSPFKATTLLLIDAPTMRVEKTFRMEKDNAFIRGMTWGGGFLWIDGAGGSRRVIKLNQRTRTRHVIRTPHPPGGLGWSGEHDELWMVDFGTTSENGSVMRMPAATEDPTTPYLHNAGENPVGPLVQGDSVWVGDWNNADVWRLPMSGSGPPRRYQLNGMADPAGVTGLAAGFGAIWVTVPDDHALWRIDTKTGDTKRIPLGRYYPWGVTVAADAIWVTVRAHDAYPDPES